MTITEMKVSAKTEHTISIRSSRFILENGKSLFELQSQNRFRAGFIFRERQNTNVRDGNSIVGN